MEASDTLLEFPCEFPLKIMGKKVDELEETIIEVVKTHAPDFDEKKIETRASSAGTYLSLTCTINATSKAQLDALYRALSSHPLVKVVL